ncbi:MULTISPECIES: minor capsid protein [Clostridia]|nr:MULTISPECIES: minor capsid protein [Clostridia]
MKNSAYWQKRFEILEEALGKYGEETYRGVQPYFDKALREINADIETWIYRIAKNNEISMKNARKLLDAGQLEEFKWTVEEYIKYGKENAINQQWVKELENASAKFHISRLEALKIKVQQSAEKAFGNYLDDVDTMARKVYEEGYYRSAFELQRGLGVGWNISSIDEKKLSKLISKPWAADGRNFSDRIWQAKNQMVYDLHSELTRACILGKGPDEAVKNLSKYVDKRFKNAKVQAGRLVMTEQAFFSAAAQKDAFNELGVEEYEIVATLDSHTSEICQQLNGKHFPMSQYEPGVTAQPFHVSCRSTTCPYFDDEFTVGEMRAARGEDGKTYQVPGDMTYPEWKSQNVIKNIKLPSDMVEDKGLSEDIKKGIEQAINKVQSEYNVRIDEVAYKDLSYFGKVPLQFAPMSTGQDFKTQLVINSKYDWNESLDALNDRIYNRNYQKGLLAGKSLEDLIYHEAAHCMTFQECQTWEAFREMERQIRKMYVSGISAYNESCRDGAESIAEAFVRIKNGEAVPDGAKLLVELYVMRWKR